MIELVFIYFSNEKFFANKALDYLEKAYVLSQSADYHVYKAKSRFNSADDPVKINMKMVWVVYSPLIW